MSVPEAHTNSTCNILENDSSSKDNQKEQIQKEQQLKQQQQQQEQQPQQLKQQQQQLQYQQQLVSNNTKNLGTEVNVTSDNNHSTSNIHHSIANKSSDNSSEISHPINQTRTEYCTCSLSRQNINPCLSCGQNFCKENSVGSSCTCQIPSKNCNCSLTSNSTSYTGFTQLTIPQPQLRHQQYPNLLNEEHQIVQSKSETLDNLENDVIHLLLNGLNAVTLAIKLNKFNNFNLTQYSNTLNGIGEEAQTLIKQLLTKLQKNNTIRSPQNTPPNVPNLCHWSEFSCDHCINCNKNCSNITSNKTNQTKMPSTTCNICQLTPMSSAPDMSCCGNDNRLLQCKIPKTINCTFQQYHPIHWTTYWPLFHSTAFL